MILGYHRVAKVNQDKYGTCVSPDHFAEQMEVLKRRAQTISLDQLASDIRIGQIPGRKIVVTFDDGYRDFFQQAKPILEKFDIPATVFVVTGFLGQVFWWDRLESALSLNPDLTNHQGLAAWFDIENSEPVDPSLDLVLPAYRKLKNATPDQIDKKIAEIESIAGFEYSGQDFPDRSMTAEELKKIASSDLIDVGSHSASHPWLAKISHEEQYEEISKSKSDLEEILGKRITSFSYPNGSVSQNTASIVEQLGFLCACSSYPDVVTKSSHLYQLPRLWVQDVDGDRFERWLSGW
jgi:peptidoglycan/xylan/chitin deacetylase (PgdA/CDA1 family)